MENSVLIKDLLKDNNLDIIAGDKGIEGVVTKDMICRPGMEFAGFFDFYEPDRIVLIGSKESTFLATLSLEVQKERVEKLYSFNPPMVVYSHNVKLPYFFVELANKTNIPLCKANLGTTAISSKLYTYLQEILAPKVSVHGTLLDIHGLGTLIIGKSGIGKSETALDLIKRGHQLISDDLVEIFEKEPGNLIGKAPKILERYMEIRGIGIVDVVSMFGAGAYRPRKNIRLVIELEEWQQNKYYDRLGLQTETMKFFDTQITKIVVPVLPGRNVALLVESAALKEKLKMYSNVDSAKDFIDAVNKKARGE